MKTEHILIEDHLLMRSAYATPQIHAHTAMSAAPIAQKQRSLVENFIVLPPIVK